MPDVRAAADLVEAQPDHAAGDPIQERNMVCFGFFRAVYVLLNHAVHHVPLLGKIRFVGGGNGLNVGLAVVVETAVDVTDPTAIESIEIEDGILGGPNCSFADKTSPAGSLNVQKPHTKG